MNELPPPKQIQMLNDLLNDVIFPELKKICKPDMSRTDYKKGSEEFKKAEDSKRALLWSSSIEYLTNNLY